MSIKMSNGYTYLDVVEMSIEKPFKAMARKALRDEIKLKKKAIRERKKEDEKIIKQEQKAKKKKGKKQAESQQAVITFATLFAGLSAGTCYIIYNFII